MYAFHDVNMSLRFRISGDRLACHAAGHPWSWMDRPNYVHWSFQPVPWGCLAYGTDRTHSTISNNMQTFKVWQTRDVVLCNPSLCTG